MSQEKVLKTLENLGLTQPDAQIYIFLGKKGPQKARDIAKSLRLSKQTVYRAIKNLQSKGLITATLEYPARFSVVPFDRVLDLFVKSKTEEAHRIEQDKNSLLSDWQSIALADSGGQPPGFTVIEGRDYIYPRLKQMIEDTKNQLSIISTVPGLVRAEQFGLLDAAFKNTAETNTRFRFLTELSDENLKAMKLLLERVPKGSSFEGRSPELGLRLISRMLIKDDVETAFFINKEANKTARDTDDLCLWTNSNAIVNSFKAVFEDLWQNSIDIKNRIAEIETGKPPSKMRLLGNEQEAKNIYAQALNAAHHEIVILTSSTGISAIKKEIEPSKESAQANLSIKIMAPITKENLEVARELSKTCTIRHISSAYIETTIVDNKHFFQFREKPPNSRDTFYTNDPEQVKKSKNMLTSIWQSARTPPALKSETITSTSVLSLATASDNEYSLSKIDSPYRKMSIQFLEEKTGQATEEDILQKIINAKRCPANNWPNKGILKFYGSCAHAVLHPPKYLKLPKVIVNAYDWNKDSSFGRENIISIHLALEKSKNTAYTPVAAVTDNPRSIQARKFIGRGTPAEHNIQLVKKDQLQVKIHGSTAFVGWTNPIPLASGYVLPPAGILVEGYGKLKTSISSFKTKSGINITYEGNAYDAFVTFYHPTTKCTEPGTDGMVVRDEIATYSLDCDES